MIRSIVNRILNYIHKPSIDKIESLNKNLNFLINQTVNFNDIITLPSVRHIQEKNIEILQKLIVFFDKHSIEYFLSNNTLLGAVINKSLVPWDDDITLGFFHEDFDKIVKHQDSLKELGLHFSSPSSGSGFFTGHGWHKMYDNEKKSHINLFVFDLVNTGNIKKLVKVREKYSRAAVKKRQKFENGSYSLQKLKTELDKINEHYFKEADFITTATAKSDTYIINNICTSSKPDFTLYEYIFPLKKQEFILNHNQAVKQFPVPGNAEGVLQDFYGKDFMYIPKDLYTKRSKKKPL